MPKHRVKLHYQKVAVARAHDILEEIYPARILQKKDKATPEAAKKHLDYLLAALETIDGLCERRDMREDV